MPLKFFQKQAKPSLFKKKTVFKYKKNSRKIKKQPPKRVFIKRKVTWFTIFCTTFLFPILVKVARAVGNASQTLGQHAGTMPQIQPPPGTGAAVAGGAVAAGVAAASMGMVLIPGLQGAGYAIIGLISFFPFAWLIIGIAILAIALFAGLMMSGALGDCNCGSCAGCDACGGSSPTPGDTSGIQQGAAQQASQQANVGTSPS